MSNRKRVIPILLLLTGVQTACSGSEVSSFRPNPSRVPENATFVVGSSPTSGPTKHPIPSVIPTDSPRPAESPRVTSRPTGAVCCASSAVHGTASTYGPGFDGFLALPGSLGGRGQRVHICNNTTDRCVYRTSNDTGPVESLHRVADLDQRTFEYLCGCTWTTGVQTVTVEFLDN